MIHKEFFGMLFLAFIAWVFIAGTPNDRIDNFCKPVGWTGNAITSLSALAVPSQQESVKHWFDKFQYGCRYMTWRLFYQEEYNKYLKTQGISPQTAQDQTGTIAKSASASASASAGTSSVNSKVTP